MIHIGTFNRRNFKCPSVWCSYLLCVPKALHTVIKTPPKSILQLTTNVYTEVKYGFESIPKWGHFGSKALTKKKTKKKNLCFRLCIMTSGLQCFCLWRRTHRERQELKHPAATFWPQKCRTLSGLFSSSRRTQSNITWKRNTVHSCYAEHWVEWRLGQTGAT